MFRNAVPPSDIVTAHIDGGARGNPGPAAYGVIIRGSDGKIVKELGEYLGLKTNNFAEYSGLLAALEYAQKEKIPALKVFSDSELLVKQMKGQYKVNSPGLVPLYERARSLVRKLAYFAIDHVRREGNRDADRVVNQVLDQQERKPR
ncbi:MAG TPA: ribonuclease HI family protein [Candidatus Angelobacter sp.]|nr:ribonuclease HI family protein [Candidatus Angelobacter sp.]